MASCSWGEIPFNFELWGGVGSFDKFSLWLCSFSGRELEEAPEEEDKERDSGIEGVKGEGFVWDEEV